MKLIDLKNSLAQNPGLNLRFVLPNGAPIPEHAHVTEVARFDKRFVDCGGTLRTDAFCRLQTWVADDRQHRLTAAKLLGILNKASAVLLSDDLEVDVEHELNLISQFPLSAITIGQGELLLQISERHTACLAMDKCVPSLTSFQTINFKPLGTHAQR